MLLMLAALSNWLGRYRSLRPVALLMNIESYATAVAAFFLWFKIFRFVRGHRRIAFLFNTIDAAATDLFFFVIVFFIMFIGFAHVRVTAACLSCLSHCLRGRLASWPSLRTQKTSGLSSSPFCRCCARPPSVGTRECSMCRSHLAHRN